MRFDLVVRGGTVIHAWGREHVDLAVLEGRVAALLAPGSPAEAGQQVQATGLWVLPGAVDVHVHFREPGLTQKEDFRTGSAAAACGGVTTVLDMPNTVPPVTNAAALRAKAELVPGRSYVDVGLYGALTDPSPHQIDELACAGAIAFKLFAGPTTGNIRAPAWGQLVESWRRAAELGLPITVHAEDRDAVEAGEARTRLRGADGYQALLASRPRFGEAGATAMALLLARETGAHVHIAHIALAEALDLLAWAKAHGLRATGETCPQYLLCTSAEAEVQGPAFKVLPPIREQADAEALWRALTSGLLDIVASDHAPHTAEEKARSSIWEVAAGTTGVETLLPLLLDQAAAGRLQAEDVVRLLCTRPAELFGLAPRKGHLLPGADADFVLVDPSATWTIQPEALHSRGRNTVFAGRQVRGRVVATWLRGQLVARDGELVGEPAGRWLPGPALAA